MCSSILGLIFKPRSMKSLESPLSDEMVPTMPQPGGVESENTVESVLGLEDEVMCVWGRVGWGGVEIISVLGDIEKDAQSPEIHSHRNKLMHT